MVNRSAVFGCDNGPSKAVSVYRFPPDKTIRKAWIRFVKMKRAQWTCDPFSHICSEHFVDEEFVNKPVFLHGFATKLYSDRVPSLRCTKFEKPAIRH